MISGPFDKYYSEKDLERRNEENDIGTTSGSLRRMFVIRTWHFSWRDNRGG